MSKVIGIDLGTGNSCVSVIENGKPVVIVNDTGDRTTPSFVSYKSDGTVVTGKSAKNIAITNPKNTIYAVKRFMGNKFSDMKEWVDIVPYKVTSGPNGAARINVNEKELSPEEISAQILSKMKKIAEDYLGESVTKAVVTVPAYFNDAQRQATKDAGKIAGLEVERLVAEPTAAAMAFGFDKKDLSKKVVVVDAGSGTLDVSVLDIADGVFEVLSTSGDSKLGGTDFDNKIVDYLVSEFKNNNDGLDISKDSTSLQRVKDAAEQAKIALSNSTSTSINLPYITADANGPKHLVLDLTRAKFEALCSDIIDRHKTPMIKALEDAGLKASDIDDILLVGGTTRVPAIQNLVKEVFGKEGNKSINPDEAVAIGAAIQGGILGGDVKQDIILLDVTPLSLGIETLGGVMTTLIPRNTTIPTKKSQIFSTAADGQTAVTIHVLQGERPMAAQNKTLGNFNLEGIPNAPKGVPQIEVSFDIDSNGIVSVSAKDLGTGKDQKITITSSTGLSEDEINKMVKEAEENAESDKKLKEHIDAKNEAESVINSVEKSVKEYGDKVTEEEKTKINDSVSRLKEVLAKTDATTDEIKNATSEAQQASYTLAEKIYASQNANNSESTTNENSSAPNFEEAFSSQS